MLVGETKTVLTASAYSAYDGVMVSSTLLKVKRSACVSVTNFNNFAVTMHPGTILVTAGQVQDIDETMATNIEEQRG